MIIKTWRGWYIQHYKDGCKHPYYVASIYRGKVEWTTDYLYARYYTSKSTAQKHDRKIAESIASGTMEWR